MSEDKVMAATETASESSATETTQDSSIGKYIAESKKYRERAQDAEARYAKLERKFAKQEEAKLKEKEDFKTLYEKASSQIDSLTSNASKWTEYENNRRTILLEKHPEEDREQLSTLDLSTLEFVTSKINNTKPNAPEAIGRSKNPVIEKEWKDMTDEEKRAHYTYMANRGNRH